jgi:SWI/SNF-related matrix-associated actin-dependent regulator of chromatin subfamily A3
MQQIAEALEEHGFVEKESCSASFADMSLNRMPYVRFDGQMSAKRRQETLERFSIPLEDELTSGTSSETPLPASRPHRRSTQMVSPEDPIDHDDNNDADFMVGIADDDDFLDDEDDDRAFSSKRRKGTGKTKGKGKGKAKSTGRISARAGFNGASFAGENPKVMLISLKAGALGLNLTVANNVYL